ncbi:RNA 2',3'-cyclic phosphodiesterase [Amycolatopsis rubida]|uniref:RNA 2',3'-cyclic phosphodiesterase n=1 Tax=Amycolatopsis rubida TaxID=112413 RepID=A0A1I5KVY5_9PSEU|nr:MULTISPECIES: RNA 2',3'-cyclic phosphodiesterase [Amycolatopsis]MYW91457.1 RNA 2',3'-cyclic phosphodiesterase [Amycolatopsis rubida]NEC56442.1 RNA 2',3'-cyclic phosphodiesterase [Amycolatopsis rubida]OAP21958.1 2',5' RNA ligase family [Amycolatopsis sp. M39]SFO89113.1 2'-5' RNA ligase [Amycolatopsis rubida]
MQLFSALRPPADVAAEVADALGARDRLLRWSDPAGWHITLAFYGEADPAGRSAVLDRALDGRKAVDVQLRSSGTFPGVLWLGVAGEDLAALAAAAGPDEERPYRPHLTLARCSRTRPPTAWTEQLAGFRSRVWTADRVELLGGGSPYRTLASWPLRRA